MEQLNLTELSLSAGVGECFEMLGKLTKHRAVTQAHWREKREADAAKAAELELKLTEAVQHAQE